MLHGLMVYLAAEHVKFKGSINFKNDLFTNLDICKYHMKNMQFLSILTISIRVKTRHLDDLRSLLIIDLIYVQNSPELNNTYKCFISFQEK